MHDSKATSLATLLTAWQAPSSYLARVAAMRSGVAGARLSLITKTNVLNDRGHDDRLSGGAGNDWFLSAIDDVMTDMVNGELFDRL